MNFFRGIFEVKKGVPNGPFLATRSLVYCFFLALIRLGTGDNSKPDFGIRETKMDENGPSLFSLAYRGMFWCI